MQMPEQGYLAFVNSYPLHVDMKTVRAKMALTPGDWKEGVSIDIDPSGKIARVQEGQTGPALTENILLPSPSNVHSHAFQRAMAGLTESRGPSGRDDFWSWRRVMYAFVESLTPEDVEAIAALAYMEMLEAGFSSVAEFHYLHHQEKGAPYANTAELSARLMAAAKYTGIGLTLLPVLYQQSDCRGSALMGGQQRFGCTRDLFETLLERAEAELGDMPGDTGIGVAIHSLRAAGPRAVAWATRLMPERPLHMHLSEQKQEVREVEAALGARPVTWVLDNCDVNERWCLVHCTQMTEQETDSLARTGAIAGLCPITESNLGDGIFDGSRFLKAKGSFGVGTDSNVRISLVDELRTLEYSQRLRDCGRAVLSGRYASTGRELFEHVCEGGVHAAGRNSGKIEAGAWADLVELKGSSITLAGLENDQVLDAWIFADADPVVQNVWSAGRHCVKDGRHIHREAIVSRAQKVLRKLRSL